MKLIKSCSNCIKGAPVLVNNDILCREKGVVSPDYSCIRHKFIPESKTYKEMNFKCIDCQYFIINAVPEENVSKGLCRLFSVRQYIGEQKNACSKFIKKPECSIS